MTPVPTRGHKNPLILSDRQGFDRRWFAPSLQAVYVPTQVGDVAAQVGAALSAHGRNVKIVSGRHCYENFVYNQTTRAIIDMSALNQCGYDQDRKAWFVDAGCENWTVYRTLLNGYGKTIPAGSCYSVGAGGHITGGGYGLLSRLHGLTTDHLTGVDIVTWDGKAATMRYVSPHSSDPGERDLFWALCGAGCGNFGVITRYYFARLPDAPDYATLWTFAWNWSDLTEQKFALLLAAYAEMVAEMPDSDFSLLKLTHSAAKQQGMVYQIASPAGTSLSQHCTRAEASVAAAAKRFEAIIPRAPLQSPLGGHLGRMNAVLAGPEPQHLTYLEALQTLNGSGPNQFGKYKSAYMNKAFPADQVAAIYCWLQTVPKGADMAQSLLQVDSYGGAINRIRPDASAIPQRSAIMKLQYQTYWNNGSPPGQSDQSPWREQAAAHVDWINTFYRAVYAATGGTPDPARDPGGTVAGCYYNYPDDVLGTHDRGNVDQALWLYFHDNYRKNPRNLVKVKGRWDPLDFFHHAQSVPVK